MRALAALLAFVAAAAWGHVPEATQVQGLAWSGEPWVWGCLAVAAALYALGLKRLWTVAGIGHGIERAQAAAFAGGWLALVAALLSPLDALGGSLFSAHMVQHELLMIVAAPLLVMGRPLATWAWAAPMPWRRALGSVSRRPAVSAAWQSLTNPLSAWALHALALWLWHAPRLFDAALASPGIHTLQHVSFLATALLFWWAVLRRVGRRHARGSAVFYLFTTMAHTTALGALLTMAPTPWYAPYGSTSGAFGLDALEDQQLGGLVMWVPGGLVYVIATLALLASMLRRTALPVR